MPGHREDGALDGDFHAALKHVQHVFQRGEPEGRRHGVHDAVEHVIECRVVLHRCQGQVLQRLFHCGDAHEVIEDQQCQTRGQHAFEGGHENRLDDGRYGTGDDAE